MTEDCISREKVFEMIDTCNSDGLKGIFCSYADGERFKEYINDLPSVQPKTEWIPVSERLPEDEQEILFSTKTGRTHSGKYHDDDSANRWYSHKDKCRAWNNVVDAWMPLPKPYSEVSNENN